VSPGPITTYSSPFPFRSQLSITRTWSHIGIKTAIHDRSIQRERERERAELCQGQIVEDVTSGNVEMHTVNLFDVVSYK